MVVQGGTQPILVAVGEGAGVPGGMPGCQGAKVPVAAGRAARSHRVRPQGHEAVRRRQPSVAFGRMQKGARTYLERGTRSNQDERLLAFRSACSTSGRYDLLAITSQTKTWKLNCTGPCQAW